MKKLINDPRAVVDEAVAGFAAAHAGLAERGIRVSRSLVGDYVSSLDMQGASISVPILDEELTVLRDAPVETSAVRWGR